MKKLFASCLVFTCFTSAALNASGSAGHNSPQASPGKPVFFVTPVVQATLNKELVKDILESWANLQGQVNRLQGQVNHLQTNNQDLARERDTLILQLLDEKQIRLGEITRHTQENNVLIQQVVQLKRDKEAQAAQFEQEKKELVRKLGAYNNLVAEHMAAQAEQRLNQPKW
jgi:regulator of replication initiation timing